MRDLLLAYRLRQIHRRIPCAHQPGEAAIIVQTILRKNLPAGPVIELGAYKGGMSAKLAFACRIAQRELYICDTFSGLPRAEEHIELHGKVKSYTQGTYAGSQEEVTAAVKSVGGTATLIAGDFATTLPTLLVTPAVVFMDVDLVSSALCALKYLWPRLIPGGIWFTHEARVRTFVEAVTHAMPGQVLWGAGYGMSPRAANLAYWIKPA